MMKIKLLFSVIGAVALMTPVCIRVSAQVEGPHFVEPPRGPQLTNPVPVNPNPVPVNPNPPTIVHTPPPVPPEPPHFHAHAPHDIELSTPQPTISPIRDRN